MEARLKTPLRYPGGKSKAIKKLFADFPDVKQFKEYREPFIGGGSVGIHVTRLNPDCKVWINDLYWPLYNFWVQLRDNGDALSAALNHNKTQHDTPDKAKELFLIAKQEVNNENNTDLERAVYFWIVNKCSFSGLTESSTFSAWASDKNFNLSGINALKEYSKHIKNWKITNLSYDQLLDADGAFIYLDPPYEIKSKLYGKKGAMHKWFDHDKFAADCNAAHDRHTIAISYNSDQSVKDRFPKWKQIEFDLTYFMRSDRKNYRDNQAERKELLLVNY